MNGTTTKKGAAGKFLALLASLTMILAGIAGVALAGPASAVAGPMTLLQQTQGETPITAANWSKGDWCADQGVTSTQDGWHFVFGPGVSSYSGFTADFRDADGNPVSYQNLGDQKTGPGGSTTQGFYVATAAGAILYGASVSADPNTGNFVLSGGCSGTTASNPDMTVTPGDVCTPDTFDSWDVSWTVKNTGDVPLDITNDGGATSKDTTTGVAVGASVKFTKTVTSADAITINFTGTPAKGDPVVKSGGYTPTSDCAKVPGPAMTVTPSDLCTPAKTGSWDVSWTVKNTGDVPLDITNNGGATSTDTTDGVASGASVTFTKTVTSADPITINFTGTPAKGDPVVKSGNHTPTSDCAAKTRPIYACDNQTQTQTQNQDRSWPALPAGWSTNPDAAKASCGSAPDYSYSQAATVAKTICTPAGTIEGASATGETVSVSRKGSDFSADEKAAVDAQAKGKADAAFSAKYGTFTEGACPVVTAVRPLPATVALPATIPTKKPAKATLPASVPAGVVTVPSKATLPGAVPAGDGSQAPGLPMWALALIAVGALGAAATGKQILAARK